MLFFELIQIAIGNRDSFSRLPKEDDWRDMFECAKKQALLGITYLAMERLPQVQRPPKEVLIQWFVITEQIKAKNLEINVKAKKVIDKFLDAKFRSVILKGQGLALLYPNGEYRTPGDIDIWLEGGRKQIADYVCQFVPNSKILYHHVDFPVIEGVDVEVHFTPSWMNNYFTNRTLQRFFKSFNFSSICRDTIEQNKGLSIPTLAFNRVYILVHIYRHLFGEGIGLRQLLDFYYVLNQGFSQEEREDTMHVLCELKMERFTKAIMWILQKVFAMDKDYMLTSPDEKEGRFLLSEIIKAGNFGQYDSRIKRVFDESEFNVFLRRVTRNFRFVRSYPSEVLWTIPFKLWHYFWRRQWNNRK